MVRHLEGFAALWQAFEDDLERLEHAKSARRGRVELLPCDLLE